jgi:predicted RNA binding protein YcfA (HicA-like mRNA interferase family)
MTINENILLKKNGMREVNQKGSAHENTQEKPGRIVLFP